MPNMFEKMTIGTMVARNRIVRAATAESLASPDGGITPELLGIYGELAWGGVGTIMTGYTYVLPGGKPSEGALGLCDDANLARFRSLADVAHENGACIVLQLVYGGSKSSLVDGDSRRLAPVGAPAVDGVPNTTVLGPSAIAHPRTGLVPTEATAAELAEVAAAFGRAAMRARACGFDGVEVHAAHGYLLSQFLSPCFNGRADEYGGTVEGRARLAAQCVGAVRAEVGEGFPVFVKLNCCDRWDDPQGARGGLSEDESAHAAALLVEAGASCIDVSGDWHAASAATAAGPYFADFGARLARELDVPVLVTGGWRVPDVFDEHLGRDGIACVGMSRPLVCEPALPRRWHSGDRAPSACVSCGNCQLHAGIPCPMRERSMA